MSALQAQTSDLNARRAALERAIRDEMERAARFASEKERIERDIAALSASTDDGPPIDLLREDMAIAEDAVLEAEEAVIVAREELAAARDAEAACDSLSMRLTARRSSSKPKPGRSPNSSPRKPATCGRPALDQITVQKGYETALGAALGDDLDASTNLSAPAHWAETGAGRAIRACPPV